MSGMAQTTSASISGVIRQESWITLKFLLPLLSMGIRETAAKPKMVVPPSEQHCHGGGVRALTTF